MMNHRFPLVPLLLVAWALGLAGCVGAPERCSGCLSALADAGGFDSPTVSGSGGNLVVGTGGITGGGGVIGSGGSGTGGAGTGGAAAGPGGRGTGGASTGGSGTGGRGTGGASTGGMGTGGASSGGSGTGGMGTGGVAPGSGGAAGATDPDLVLWYKFDETTGTSAVDSAMFGGTARNGTLTTVGGGTAAFSTTRQVGTSSVNLTGSSATVGGYLTTLPSPGLQALAPNAVTIACWVFVRTNQNWQRVFDFGVNTTGAYMFLSTNQATNPNSVRFAITTSGNANEQMINMTAPATLSLNVWHHLVVVLPAGATYTGSLYIDGALAGTNTAMTLHPTNLGATANNFLGKSLFPDAYFSGQLDDFRVYRRALTPAEITALFAVR